MVRSLLWFAKPSLTEVTAMSRRNDRRRDNPSSKYLTVWTNCTPDDYFDAYALSVAYEPTTKKIYIPYAYSGTYTYGHVMVRNPDLSYYTKKQFVAGQVLTSFIPDEAYCYAVSSVGNKLYKTPNSGLGDSSSGYNTSTSVALNTPYGMFTSSDLPNHLLITCNNAVDGHGIRLVRKSTLATAASILATGSGNNQFNAPFGIDYIASTSTTGKAYICDSANNRIVELNVDLSAETLTWSTTYSNANTTVVKSICHATLDGVFYWFVSQATALRKFTSDFSTLSASYTTKGAQTSTLIPDQGDNADSTNPTLVVLGNADYAIRRHKTSDLTLISSIGSNGSNNTFDPVITGVAGTWKMDDGSQVNAAAATDISWNGFAGYTFKTSGTHKAVFKPSTNVISGITGINFDTDSVTQTANFNRTNATTIVASANSDLNTTHLYQIPYTTTTMTYYSLAGTYHYIKDIPRTVSTVQLAYGYRFYGSVDQIPDISITANLAYMGVYNSLTTGSIATKTAIQTLSLTNSAWSSASVDTVLLSASDATWTDLNKYTYSSAGNGPTLAIGGTNAAPGGGASADTVDPLTTPGSGNSNSDWSWTSGTQNKIMGYTTGIGNSTNAAGYLVVQKFTAVDATISDIYIYCSGSGTAKVGVYSDSGGVAGTLLSAQQTATAVIAGWNKISLSTPLAVTNGTSYWLAQNNSTSVSRTMTGLGGSYGFASLAFANNLPASAPTMATGTTTCLIAAYGTTNAHKALTGKAACYYLRNMPLGHLWTITKTA
jgi:hypothetical protein